MNAPRILIVDDEPKVAFFFQKHLEMMEYMATAVNSGDAALKELRQHHYDLMITDLRMPGMDGLELLRHVRSISPQTQTILVTAYGTDEVWHEAERLQTFRTLSKPFKMPELLSVVREALSQTKTRTSGILALTGESFERLALFESQIVMLQTLVDDLLTVTRLDRRLMPPTFKRVDFNTIITKVLESQAVLAISKGLTLTCDVSLEEPLFIHGDSELLTRVFVNLIANAVNYTPNGGRIAIASYREEMSAVFVVDDTGIGISPHDLPHIFDRFYRSENARKTGHGIGLGLAIVKEIVDLHKGKIDVKSAPNEGTCFRVYIPTEAHLVY